MTGNTLTFSSYKPSNGLWLAFLRCSVSALALVHFIAIQFDFNNIFSVNAFVAPDITDVLKDSLLPSIYIIYHSIKIIADVDYANVLLAIRIFYPLALLMLLVGFFTRVTALLSLFFQLIILNSMDFYSYGVDVFTTITLFYCFIFPVGRFLSIDGYLFKKTVPPGNLNQYLRVFRAHVCVIYFFSGFEKLLGYNWRNGESMWKMVHGYNTVSFIDLDFLSNTPFFLCAGWMTIALEMLYPIFINIKRTRKLWLISVIGFHVIIAFFMGLYFFSCMMIILNLTAYYIPFLQTADKVIEDNDNLVMI